MMRRRWGNDGNMGWVSLLRVLLVRVDWAFVLGGHFTALPPLPVVAIVVDLLARNRCLGRDVVREIVWSLPYWFLVSRLPETHGEVDDDRLPEWDESQKLAADYEVDLPQ